MRRAARQSGAGAPIPCGMVARNLEVVNTNLLPIRYSFERIAKSFKRGELQRRWGGKVTIGKTRGKTSFWANGVRGVTRVVRAGQGACLLGCCAGDSKPAHAKTCVLRHPNSLHEPVGHPSKEISGKLGGR
jgi:hypothetical protein